jgi:hypothetical protein
MISESLIRLLIIFFSAMSIGMLIGLLFRKKYEFHGPNADQYSKKIFYHKKANKCISFVPIIESINKN